MSLHIGTIFIEKPSVLFVTETSTWLFPSIIYTSLTYPGDGIQPLKLTPFRLEMYDRLLVFSVIVGSLGSVSNGRYIIYVCNTKRGSMKEI
jgi:hypothetical protein